MNRVIRNKILLSLFLFVYQPVAKPSETQQLIPVNSMPLTRRLSEKTVTPIYSTQKLPPFIDTNPHECYTYEKSLTYENNCGVVREDLLFLDTTYKINQAGTLTPESVGIHKFSNRSCSDKNGCSYWCSAKEIVAFYNKKTNFGLDCQNCYFCIATEPIENNTKNTDSYKNKKYSVNFIFPLFIECKHKDTDLRFFNKADICQSYVALKKRDNQAYEVNDNALLKTHLYQPMIDENSNTNCYVFLHKKNSTGTQIDIAYFCSTDTTPFKIKDCVDEKQVENSIKKHFNKSIEEVFYILYTAQNKTNDAINLPKNVFSSIECTITILDTFCKDYTNFIQAQFLVHVILSSAVERLNNEKITLPHFYGLLSTHLPLNKTYDQFALNWTSTFFIIPSTVANTFNKNLFFADDKDAMPRNDVRRIITRSRKQDYAQEPNSPALAIITGINEYGFITDQFALQNKALLTLQNNEPNALALERYQNTSTRQTYINKPLAFEPTEALKSLLNTINASSRTTNCNQAEQSISFESLLQFSLPVLNQIKNLEEHVHTLQATVDSLSRQHNDLFLIKKKIATKKQKLDRKITDLKTQEENLVKLQKKQLETFSAQCDETIKKQVTILEKQKQEIEKVTKEAIAKELEQKQEKTTRLNQEAADNLSKIGLSQKKVEALIATLAEQTKELESTKQSLDDKISQLDVAKITKDIKHKHNDNIKQFKQRNTYLTYALADVGATSFISIFLFILYIHKMNARINALEAFSMNV